MATRCILLLPMVIAANEFVKERQCVQIDYQGDTCRDLPYNHTTRQSLESTVWLDIEQFMPLVQKHGRDLKFFLCSVYLPMCTDKVPQPIGPCRPLCEKVKRQIEPTLNQFGYSWPDLFNCTRFPAENNAETMCMIGPQEESHSKPVRPVWSGDKIETSALNLDQDHFKYLVCPGSSTAFDPNMHKTCGLTCDTDRRQVFTVEQRSVFTGLLLAVSIVTCSLAVIVCIILIFRRDMPRRKLPRVCLLYITIFCAVEAATKIGARAIDVACTSTEDGMRIYSTADLPALTTASCKFTAVVIYYFGTVYRIWFLHMCLIWMLTSARPLYWTQARLQKIHGRLHAIALIIPACCVVAILLVQAVDADPATSLCSVGMQNTAYRNVFLLSREAMVVALAALFLAAGVVCQCTRSTGMPQSTSTTQATTVGSANMGDHTSNTSLVYNSQRAAANSPAYVEIPQMQHQVPSVATSVKTAPVTSSSNYKIPTLCLLYLPIGVTLIAALINESKNPYSYEGAIVRILASDAFPLIALPAFCAWLCFAYWPQAPSKAPSQAAPVQPSPSSTWMHQCQTMPGTLPRVPAQFASNTKTYDFNQPLIQGEQYLGQRQSPKCHQKQFYDF